MILFKRKKKLIKKAAKETEKRYRKVPDMFSKGGFEEAYKESLEAYRNLMELSVKFC